MSTDRSASAVLLFEHKGHMYELRAVEPRYAHQCNDEAIETPMGIHFRDGADTTSIDMTGIALSGSAFHALRDISSVRALARVAVDGCIEEMDGVFYVDTFTFQGGRPRVCEVRVTL